MKPVSVLLLLIVVMACLLCIGCAVDSNCIRVDAGRPFIAQDGMHYYIQEGGITYQFNQSAYPNAQVVYVDPDRYYYDLQPGRVYVMLVDPTYLVRRQQDEESTERLKETMDDWAHSFDGMFKPSP